MEVYPLTRTTFVSWSRALLLLSLLAFWLAVGVSGATAATLDQAATPAAATPAASTPPPPEPDPSGIKLGSGADLAGIAPGSLTADDFAAAAKSEPFAA